MAIDWIKMRTDLYRDPKVCAMADHLRDVTRDVTRDDASVTRVTRSFFRNAVIGGLLSVWGVARTRGKRIDSDLLLTSCSLAVLDDISELPGFGEAMASVDWAEQTDEGVVFRAFFNEYNVDPKENRSAAAERQKRYRDRKNGVDCDITRYVTRDITEDVTSHAREEKRREDKEDPPTPLGGVVATKPPKRKQTAEHPLFAEFWQAYPRKTAKPAAVSAFRRIDPTPALLSVMLAAIDQQSRSQAWTKDNGAFIPHPATWLNQRRWEDQKPTPQKQQPTLGYLPFDSI